MTQPAAAKLKETPQERPTDPNVIQRRAAQPESSVWVGASAGSGKTKVLTDRVLRLLLPGEDGAPGTPPHKILCLTFTKIAAREMAVNITGVLGRWVVLSDEALRDALTGLLGRPPRPVETAAARRLFAEVVDAPGSLQIMTIHSFCHSVLSRFPLEAGLPVSFKLIQDREASELLLQARDAVLQQAEAEKASPLAEAVARVGGAVNEDQFFELVENFCAQRSQLQQLLNQNFGPHGLHAKLCEELDLDPGRTPEQSALQACRDDSFDYETLRRAAAGLAQTGGQMRLNLAQSIADWLAMDPQTRAENFKSYGDAYLTQKGEPNGKIFSEAFRRDHNALAGALLAEAARIIDVRDSINAAACALLTRDLLVLGEAVLDHYRTLKNARALVDFDDLIQHTAALLRQDGMAGWVMFKLDQGIDHILVDEAQDTNPDQWKVIEALSAEFTGGAGARSQNRTVFVVGDEKQSIYSFQRASPQEFRRMHAHFENRFRQAGLSWATVPLNISFRSTSSVLRAVDSTFAPPAMRAGVADSDILHTSHRNGQAGLVELWPLFKTGSGDEKDPWDPPVSVIESQNAAARLAQDIAHKIAGWIGNEYLPSRGRAMQPGDILILVRTRNAFFNQLSMALKNRGLPVSGVDRMVLNDQIAVQDLLALAEWALLPSDDLSLAAVLKSPVIGWSEEQLYALAIDRPGSLWEALRSGTYPAEKDYLQNLIALAGTIPPYEFFSAVLQQPCPADAISGLRAITARLGAEALDPLDELLNAALEFERGHIASLQGFLHWQARESSGIKREMEDPRNEVRIMTVHGAKGLQAPVVILPDTVRSAGGGQKDRQLLWPDKSGLSAPFWAPRADMACQAFWEARARIDAAQEEEYRRLLYVAMTRAADRLYVAGHEGKNAARPESWYFMIEKGLRALDDLETLADGSLRISNPQAEGKKPDKPDKKKEAGQNIPPPPEWLTARASAEPAPPRPLTPSRPVILESPVLSPRANDTTHRFRRGNLTHKLLQYLPEIADAARENAAQDFVRQFAADLPAETRNSIVAETLTVLRHPEFSVLFSPGALAEVPVTGLLDDGHIISGQIDRLLVTDRDILIVDYKTSRQPPADVKDVPPVYLRQMEAYAAALGKIYKGRTIRCALLWTDGPFLMPL